MDIAKDSIDLGLVVRDLDACRRFYGEQLGLPFEAELPVPSGGRMYRYKIGGTVLKLVKKTETPPAGPAGLWGQSGLRYFTISVNDLDQAVGDLQGKGLSFTVAPFQVRPGVRAALLPDPDGNMVELLEIRRAPR